MIRFRSLIIALLALLALLALPLGAVPASARRLKDYQLTV